MKNHYFILLGIAALLFASCNKDKFPPPDKNKYIYDIPAITLTENAIVGAYYTNITSSYWQKSGVKQYTGTPTLGEYVSVTPQIMNQHVEWADQAQLDYFIFGWNAGTTEAALIDAFNAARDANSVRMVVNFNTSHMALTNDAPLQSDAKLTQLINEFTNTLLPLFESDSYFKINGRPVVMITPINLSSSALASIDYSLVLPALKQEMAAHDQDLYIIGEFTNGWTAPANYPANNLAPFDAVVLKDWSTNDYDRHYGYFSFIDLNWQNWTRTLSPMNTDFVPCVFPAYDNKNYTTNSTDYTFGQNGITQDYITNCNLAKKNIGRERLIILNSWNEFHYGTNIEPTEENKSAFLGITKAQFKVK